MADSRTDVNKKYFDNEAASYDTKHEKTINDLIEHVRSRKDFIGVEWDEGDDDEPAQPVRLLDYACGTGTMSRALAPFTTQCVGIDLSENMVAAYNERASNQGLAPDEMHAYQGNLLDPADLSPAAFEGPAFTNFDLATVGLGFHHFDDPALAARRLAERLRPDGGVLLIIDFLPHDPFKPGESHSHGHGHGQGHDHDHDHAGPAATVTHHGFSAERVREIFEQAGVGKEFAMTDLGSVRMSVPEGHSHDGEGMKRRVFMARGERG